MNGFMEKAVMAKVMSGQNLTSPEMQVLETLLMKGLIDRNRVMPYMRKGMNPSFMGPGLMAFAGSFL